MRFTFLDRVVSMADTFPSHASSHGADSEKPFEIFSLIWLDASANIHGVRNAEQQLRSIINNLRKFQNVEECQKYIEDSSDSDRFVLVVSGQFGQQIVRCIHPFRQVVSIYVYCMNMEAHEKWALKFRKVSSSQRMFSDSCSLFS